jgi:hypothetical protein
VPSRGRVRRSEDQDRPGKAIRSLARVRFSPWLSSKYASMFTNTGISISLDYPEYRSLQTIAWAAKVERPSPLCHRPVPY